MASAEKPGFYRGLHYTEYVDEVKALKRQGETERVEALLRSLVEATEAESQTEGYGVAPWYYEELAKLYRKQRNHRSECTILERFARQKHAPGVTPPKLLERLKKVQAALTWGPG